VAFRSRHPEEATVKLVLKELQDNHIDDKQLLESMSLPVGKVVNRRREFRMETLN